jgi:hypothetical protein
MKPLLTILAYADRYLTSSHHRLVPGGCMFDIQVEAAWCAHRPANQDLPLDATGNALAIPM